MLFARLVLLVQALVWGALGVLYWVRPYEMANLSGMLLMEPSAVSDARVFYGGHQFALALFLLFALRRASLVQPALILVVLLQSILTLSRLLIAWIEGGMEADGNLFGLLFRGAMAALGIAAPAVGTRRERRASRGRLRRPVTFKVDCDSGSPSATARRRGRTLPGSAPDRAVGGSARFPEGPCRCFRQGCAAPAWPRCLRSVGSG